MRRISFHADVPLPSNENHKRQIICLPSSANLANMYLWETKH
jgi:hypothetical protein